MAISANLRLLRQEREAERIRANLEEARRYGDKGEATQLAAAYREQGYGEDGYRLSSTT